MPKPPPPYQLNERTFVRANWQLQLNKQQKAAEMIYLLVLLAVFAWHIKIVKHIELPTDRFIIIKLCRHTHTHTHSSH